MHQPSGNSSEHRLALLLSDVVLELHQLVGHAVERLAELVKLVAAGDVGALFQPSRGDRLGATSQGEDGVDERTTLLVAEADSGQKCERDDGEELELESVHELVGLASLRGT